MIVAKAKFHTWGSRRVYLGSLGSFVGWMFRCLIRVLRMSAADSRVV